MSQRRALTFQQLIKRLILLGAGVPPGPAVGEKMHVYEECKYMEHYCGRFATLLCRDQDELVPVEEIASVLAHLKFDGATFWAIQDHEVSHNTVLDSTES